MDPLQVKEEEEEYFCKLEILDSQVSLINSDAKKETTVEYKNETKKDFYQPKDKKALILKLKCQIAGLLETNINPLNNRINFSKKTVDNEKEIIKKPKPKKIVKKKKYVQCVKCLNKIPFKRNIDQTCENCCNDNIRELKTTVYSSWKHPRAYVCIVCREVFPRSRKLLYHQRLVHNVLIEGVPISYKPKVKRFYLCEVCGKSLRANRFDEHAWTHTGDKPYKCKFCDRMFRKRGTLKAHIRIHTGQKPFVCKQCGKSYIQVTSLRIHERYHLKEKPFKCPMCSRGFIYKKVLHVHMGNCTGTKEDDTDKDILCRN